MCASVCKCVDIYIYILFFCFFSHVRHVFQDFFGSKTDPLEVVSNR